MKITLKRITSHELAVMQGGKRIGTANQAPGGGRVYYTKLFVTEISGLGQRDLLARINYVRAARGPAQR